MKDDIVVSNASPLIFLDKIHELDLLKQCFGKVIISQAVCDELGTMEVPEFIKKVLLNNESKSFVDGAVGRLHHGELEAVRLAIDHKISYILLDDLLARRYARRFGLIPIGILGIMKISYHKGIISMERIRNSIYELVEKHNYFIKNEFLEDFFSSIK